MRKKENVSKSFQAPKTSFNNINIKTSLNLHFGNETVTSFLHSPLAYWITFN